MKALHATRETLPTRVPETPNSRILKSVSSCIHSAKLPRPSSASPLVNRCDGDGLHVTLVSGPRRGIVKTGDRVRSQIVCRFAYTADQKHGFVTVLITPSEASGIRQRIERAADELVLLIQHGGSARGVYRLAESQGLIAEDT